MNVKKYVKKPIEIEAIQINSENFSEIKDFCKNNIKNVKLTYGTSSIILDHNSFLQQVDPENRKPMLSVTIHTLEGDMTAREGDYIIKGVKGEFYPCRKDIFEETYEEVR